MSAIAQGKENAANIKVGDRILVKHYTMDNEADRATLEWLGKDRALGISRTKTGEGVTVARVLDVQAVMVQGRRAQRRYNIITTEGVLENNAPIQTMIMAPEDAAGIKRAHAEALELDKVYEVYPVAETTDALPTATEDEAYEAQEAALEGEVTVTPQEFLDTLASRAALDVVATPNASDRRAAEVDTLRAEFTGSARWVPQRRLAIRLRLAQLSATVYPDRFETQEEYEVDRLRARHAATNHAEERERIVGKLAALGTVVHPEGSPEYARYRTDLRAALADPKAWDFLDV